MDIIYNGFCGVPEKLTVEDVAEVLCVLPVTVESFVNDKKISSTVVNGTVIFDRADVLALMKQNADERNQAFESLFDN